MLKTLHWVVFVQSSYIALELNRKLNIISWKNSARAINRIKTSPPNGDPSLPFLTEQNPVGSPYSFPEISSDNKSWAKWIWRFNLPVSSFSHRFSHGFREAPPIYPRTKFRSRGKLIVYLYPRTRRLPYNIIESRGQVTNQALVL